MLPNWVAPQPSGEADVGHRHLVLPRTKRALSILRNGYVIFIFSLYTASVCMWRCSINTYCRSPQCPSCRKLLRILSNFLPLATGLPDLSDEQKENWHVEYYGSSMMFSPRKTFCICLSGHLLHPSNRPIWEGWKVDNHRLWDHIQCYSSNSCCGRRDTPPSHHLLGWQTQSQSEKEKDQPEW